MKHIKSFKIFENQGAEISIDKFLQEIGMSNRNMPIIVDWWSKNRNHIKIYHFPFSSPHPIAGVILSENEIAVNKKMNMPPHIKLFLVLHESRHCDQHSQGIFNPEYYETVVQGNKSEFLRNYVKLEQDANDFAINSMREIGFDLEMNREERNLRRNEGAGHMVYDMMTQDIRRFQPIDFIDLLKKQVF
jgi:hypothetical protein